eukprot:1391793-Amorphochlora_amoeboformis.AAC.3
MQERQQKHSYWSKPLSSTYPKNLNFHPSTKMPNQIFTTSATTANWTPLDYPGRLFFRGTCMGRAPEGRRAGRWASA